MIKIASRSLNHIRKPQTPVNAHTKRNNTETDSINKRSVKVQKFPKHSLNQKYNLVSTENSGIGYQKAKNFPTGSKNWSVQDTRICSKLADFVYSPQNKTLELEGKALTPLTHHIQNHGLEEVNGVFNDRKTDGQAMAWESADAIYVSFRGTESVEDAKQDMKIGFSNSTNNAFDKFMLNSADYAKKNNKKLVITGHSLGAHHVNRFASKAAKNEQFSNLKDATFIGFASPQFSRKANVLNIGMKNDPVFGILSTASHSYIPSWLKSSPQYVDGLKFSGGHSPFKSPSAHYMANIQDAVNTITNQNNSL